MPALSNTRPLGEFIPEIEMGEEPRGMTAAVDVTMASVAPFPAIALIDVAVFVPDATVMD